jgi:hypothetical protein
MKRLLTNILALLALTFSAGLAAPVAVSVASAAPAPSSAIVAAESQSKAAVCEGVGLTGSSCTSKGTGINGIIKATLEVLSFVVGIAAVIMIIISGFRYITSGGDASKIASAKSTLIYAVVGLVVVALSQTIVYFVLGKLS